MSLISEMLFFRSLVRGLMGPAAAAAAAAVPLDTFLCLPGLVRGEDPERETEEPWIPEQEPELVLRWPRGCSRTIPPWWGFLGFWGALRWPRGLSEAALLAAEGCEGRVEDEPCWKPAVVLRDM